MLKSEQDPKSKVGSRWQTRKQSDTDYIELNRKIAPLTNLLG